MTPQELFDSHLAAVTPRASPAAAPPPQTKVVDVDLADHVRVRDPMADGVVAHFESGTVDGVPARDIRVYADPTGPTMLAYECRETRRTVVVAAPRGTISVPSPGTARVRLSADDPSVDAFAAAVAAIDARRSATATPPAAPAAVPPHAPTPGGVKRRGLTLSPSPPTPDGPDGGGV